mmetsp:Transcript_32491/g.30968  ORF Transcript_32491/g.30968 Transcript_32491/m.30968 type:complete len:170 (+) Transcript_32491:195-704(+)
MIAYLETKRKLVVLLLISICMISCQSPGKFNIFKDYSKAKIRPAQYSTTRTAVRHPINEYLDEKQMKMKRHRNGPDSPNKMFQDKGWRGSKEANTNTGETRRLLYKGEAANNTFIEKESLDGYTFYSLLIFIGIFGTVAAIFSKFLFVSTKLDKTEVENYENINALQVV